AGKLSSNPAGRPGLKREAHGEKTRLLMAARRPWWLVPGEIRLSRNGLLEGNAYLGQYSLEGLVLPKICADGYDAGIETQCGAQFLVVTPVTGHPNQAGRLTG